MDYRINNSNKYIHTIISQAVSQANTSQIQQLTAKQRELILHILNDPNKIFQYQLNVDLQLDKELRQISRVLSGKTEGRSETKSAQISRGFKTIVGQRISSEDLRKSLLNPNAEFRKAVIFDFQPFIPKTLYNPKIALDKLPYEITLHLQNMMWTHVDLGKTHTTFTELEHSPAVLKLHDEYLQLNYMTKNLDPEVRGYIQDISTHILHEHLHLSFEYILPAPFLEQSQIQALPETTKRAINDLAWAHRNLQAKQLPPATPLDHPAYQEFNVAITNFEVELEQLPAEMHQALKGAGDYLRAIDQINAQRPFLVFSDNDPGQRSREVNAQRRDLEATRDNPELAKEHSWAQEGFVRPIIGFNLWVKDTLQPTPGKTDHLTLKMESRVNMHGSNTAEEAKVREFDIDLTPFRTSPDTPLTERELYNLRSVLSIDTVYSEESWNKKLPLISALSPEQKGALRELHDGIVKKVSGSLQELYKR